MNESFLGILSLDTRFPRISGDAGNPETYPFDAKVQVVTGADSAVIVADSPPPDALLGSFITAAQELEAAGAFALVSTCGFLITAQDRIAAAVKIPVAVSGLSLLPLLQQCYGGGKIGILTASATALGPACLRAAKADLTRILVAGLESDPVFAATFLSGKDRQSTTLDRSAMEGSVVARASRLKRDHPELRAILLECGNLPPYAEAIRQATGLPVHSVLDLAKIFHDASLH